MISTPAPFITNSSDKMLTTEAPQTQTVLMDSTATLAPPVYSAPIYKKATGVPKFVHVKGQQQMLLNELQPIQSLK
jgi:hypothetical protein